MLDETQRLELPPNMEGDVVIRRRGCGEVTLDGWVGSLDGHRLALAFAFRLAGQHSVDDRVAIALGRHATC